MAGEGRLAKTRHPFPARLCRNMRARARRRQNAIAIIAVLLFISGLVVVNAAWPQGFTAFVAIGGTVGALMVLYEVRLTKQLAQAEFIRDLQTSFTSDTQIAALWQKLLLGQDVTPADRHLMSSYLTFFETIQLLHAQGALGLDLIDDLFRNRFFTAVGHPVILRETLVKKVGAFTNIHELISVWHRHLTDKRKPIHDGYYAYIEAVMEAKGFELVRLGPEHLDDLLALQSVVQDHLGKRPWLRENSAETFAECLRKGSPHIALGAVKDGALAAAAILYHGGTGDESIKRYFTDDEDELESSINLKLVLTDPRHRRHMLGATLVKLLEFRASTLGRRDILCTIHPDNAPSRKLFAKLGYKRYGRVRTKYGRRLVYRRSLWSIDAHWIR